MKKFFVFFFLITLFYSCKEQANPDAALVDVESVPIPELMEKAVIYEANIRQYSPEGTFNAFAKDIPVLKDLGVKIIWVMPINPISKIKRKATGEKFTSEIENEEERKKYLGSYYSISDYKTINPEFGTFEDFKNLVDTAHDNEMLLIVDWVPNHTGWDHPWITTNPEYYTQNSKGEIIDPLNPDTGESWGWTDVADLNYDNMEMRQEMIRGMKYWVENADIDGFRMDVAHQVPLAFFEEAIAEMKTIKPIFMLAEAEQPNLLQIGFDMQYGWDLHHLLNDIAQGTKNVADFDIYMTKVDTLLKDGGINMNFITNHDENSWSGTLGERMPNNKEIFTALTYIMPGMPLLYSGQEYDLNHRLKFFEKDSIPKTKGKYYELLEKLGAFKNNNKALNTGINPATYIRINTSDDKSVLAFCREKNQEKVVFIGNLSDMDKGITLDLKGSYTNYLSGRDFEMEKNATLQLAPWEYRILVGGER
ncbi:MAG TPA: alpha-amylase family glycosyl hydrolase [Arenibacter sp.]|nr:alpha-amylase family glycosyl hydrolase [Arenibacter sp.]